jgi:hypothetical protein
MWVLWSRFPPSNSVSPANSLSTIYYLSSGAGTIGALVAEVPRELRLTPPHKVKRRTNRLLRQGREAELVKRSRMCGFIHPLPRMSSWRST